MRMVIGNIAGRISFAAFTLIVFTPLIWSNWFVDPVLTPKLIWFGLSNALFVMVSSTYLLLRKEFNTLRITWIDLSVFSFFCYVHVSHLVTDSSFVSAKVSILTAVTANYFIIRLLSGVWIISDKLKTAVSWLLVFMAFVSSSIALYQYVLLRFFNIGIGMIAGMGNSGALASYLSVIFPFLIVLAIRSEIKRRKYIYIAVLVLTTISLLLTEARAAWIAVAVSSSFCICCCHMDRLKSIAAKFSKAKLSLLFSEVLFLIIASASALYYLKPDSASGRVFIWQRTLDIIADHPFLGTGYGKFESTYPLYQASYLADSPNDPAAFLASDVNHTFNEYLFITAELGIVGLLLLGFILISLCIAFFDQYSRLSEFLVASYAGIISLLVLSLFTYPFKIPSLLFLFVCFLAFISSHTTSHLTTLKMRYVMSLGLIGVVVMLLVAGSEMRRFNSERAWKEVYDLRTDIGWKTISRVYGRLYALSSDNGDFLYNYGAELAVHGDFGNAVKILNEASNYMKTSDLYTHLGVCYEETDTLDKAKESFTMAANLVPHKFYPKYRLVYIYDKMGMKEEAMDLAKRILTTPAKVNSRIVEDIKLEMRNFIRQYD